MIHNFKAEDLQRLVENSVLDNHPAYAKVWRDLDSGSLIVTVTDDFAWFPEHYEFLGYMHQAQAAHAARIAYQLAESERYPAPRVRIAAAVESFSAS